MAIHIDLEDLYYEDKKEREDSSIETETVELHTQERLKKLKKLLPNIDQSEIWNCHYVAYLLQHGNSEYEYKLAHDYAQKAIAMGSSVTKWLYAATLDRWLISQGKKQKYGTQFKFENGNWELLSTDESVTDEERKEYGVPPLSQAYNVFIEKYKKSL